MLHGEVAARRPDHVVVLCGGVGYRAAVSAQTLRHVGPVGERVALHTHLIAREDALTLYGFHSEAERELFLLLLGVQAVGPKVALAVLSSASAGELAGAIAAGDGARFQTVPGIGKRTAERIIVELREKVADSAGIVPAAAGVASSSRRARPEGPRDLARGGLLELGFGIEEADALLGDVEGDSAEQLIAAALRLARSGPGTGARAGS